MVSIEEAHHTTAVTVFAVRYEVIAVDTGDTDAMGEGFPDRPLL